MPGTGADHVTRDLIEIAGAAQAVSMDPSPVMVEQAQHTFSANLTLSFETCDSKQTGLANSAVDLVAMHTLLCHVPGRQDVIRDAYRVLKPGGLLAICHGD